MIDFSRGAKTTGSKFYFNEGDTALLEWKLISQMIDFHVNDGYKFVLPPYLVKKEVGEWAGMLPRFEGEYYYIQDGFMLLPTAEVAMVGYRANEIIPEEELPLKYVAFSPCWRREAGTYGKRDKGLRRVHQFHKVELFHIATPSQSSFEFGYMVGHVMKLLGKLGVEKTRMRRLSKKEKSPVAKTTTDIDIQLPSTGEWLEVSSISNTGENQSKPALIRYRPKGGGKPIKCHLLNGSGVALPRLMLVLLENANNS